MVLTLQDARNAGYCVSGIRARFAEHGLDFRTFVKHGLPEDVLRATGDDGIVDKVIAVKIGDQHGG